MSGRAPFAGALKGSFEGAFSNLEVVAQRMFQAFGRRVQDLGSAHFVNTGAFHVSAAPKP